jgi:hypothetical protein
MIDGDVNARQLQELERLLSPLHGWPEKSTANAAAMINAGLVTGGSEIRRIHSRHHRSHGRQLCERNCLEYDLCACLKLTLDQAGITSPAPIWLLLVESVEKFLRTDLYDPDRVRRAISRDLVKLAETVCSTERWHSSTGRRLRGRYAATTMLLKYLAGVIFGHPGDSDELR